MSYNCPNISVSYKPIDISCGVDQNRIRWWSHSPSFSFSHLFRPIFFVSATSTRVCILSIFHLDLIACFFVVVVSLIELTLCDFHIPSNFSRFCRIGFYGFSSFYFMSKFYLRSIPNMDPRRTYHEHKKHKPMNCIEWMKNRNRNKIKI